MIKFGQLKDIIIIDDEADFASPNAKVNKAQKTRINELITALLGRTGDYIGVTATLARLVISTTPLDNDNRLWVNFPPHPLYTGQDIFFPLEWPGIRNQLDFQLNLLPDRGDDPKYARQALFSFFVNVSYLNLYVNQVEANYSLLVHTSGKKADQKARFVNYAGGYWLPLLIMIARILNVTSKIYGVWRMIAIPMPMLID